MRYSKLLLVLLTTLAASLTVTSLLPQPIQSQAPQPSQAIRTCPAINAGRAANLPPDPDWEAIKEWDDKITRNQTDPLDKNVKEETITSLAFSPDGRLLATGSKYVDRDRLGTRGSVRIWSGLETIKRQRKRMYISESPINTLAFSPNGLFLVTGESNGGVSVWKREEWGREKLTKSTSREVIFEPRSITVSPAGQVVAAGIGRPNGRSMRLWNIRSIGQLQPVRQQIQEISRYPIAIGTSEKQRIDAVAFSPNGKVLAAAGRAILSTTQPVTKEQESTYYINFWDAVTGRYLCTLDNSNFSTSSITFTADGTMFVAADPVEGVVRRWSLSTFEPLPPLRHGGQVRVIASSPSGKILLTGGRDRKVKLWQLQTGQEINVFEKNDGEITAVVFRPDGRAFVTGSVDKSFRTFIYPSR